MSEFVEFLKAVPFLGDASILILAFILLATGKLWTGRSVDYIIKGKDTQIADLWETVRNQDSTARELIEQNKKLLELGSVTNKLLTEIVDPNPGE